MDQQYGDDVASILVFGPNRDGVVEFVNEAKEICQRKGLDYDGPISLPNQEMEEDDPPFSEEDMDLFGQEPTEEEREVLPGNRVFRRVIRVYRGGEAVSMILSLEVPENVFLRALIDQRTHYKGGGDSPHTYDPRLDYKTEL